MEDNSKVQELLSEFEQQRDSLKTMVDEIESIRGKVSNLFPDSLDARSVRFFKEKVETFTEFYKMLLDLRKEIMKSVKEEIEMRRKLGNVDDEMSEDDIMSMLDITKLASHVEKLNKEKEKTLRKVSND